MTNYIAVLNFQIDCHLSCFGHYCWVDFKCQWKYCN